ncbi:keratin, type I cytoskeletal 47 kDa-like [Pelobates fuscus]|uniref:keratin, type I cytoskeletal 47 kDa-like n=1 Tax=Pelobates fuscus TaxID=191477 RepID=UPI002FE4BC60
MTSYYSSSLVQSNRSFYGSGAANRSGGSFGGSTGGGFGSSYWSGVNGGASGEISISSSDSGFGGGFPGNEKQTMQSLNDRLAAYLEKVRALEAANSDLEQKIREWYEKQLASANAIDYIKHFEIIQDLRNEILATTLEKSRVVLQIDNARMVADDLRLKYENELLLHQIVVADINRLSKALNELTMTRDGLEIQIESLTEELTYLKKNHEEEISIVKSSGGGQINVEMDAAPGLDLTKILNDMRANYEALAETNYRDAEQWFNQQSKELKKEISAGMDQVQTSKREISDLRRSLQTLEIELEAQQAMRKSLENAKTETQGRYGAQLQQLQLTISGLEEQLFQVRSDSKSQSLEYQQLLDIKNRLELEIKTYCHLLDGEFGSSSSSQSAVAVSPTQDSVDPKKGPTKTRKTKTIVEIVENGTVVSAELEETEEEID